MSTVPISSDDRTIGINIVNIKNINVFSLILKLINLIDLLIDFVSILSIKVNVKFFIKCSQF